MGGFSKLLVIVASRVQTWVVMPAMEELNQFKPIWIWAWLGGSLQM